MQQYMNQGGWTESGSQPESQSISILTWLIYNFISGFEEPVSFTVIMHQFDKYYTWAVVGSLDVLKNNNHIFVQTNIMGEARFFVHPNATPCPGISTLPIN